MNVRITQQHCYKRVCGPCLLIDSFPSIESDDARKSPERLEQCDYTTFIKLLAQPRHTEKRENMEDRRGNREKVSIKLKCISQNSILCRTRALTVLNPSPRRVSVR